MPRAIPKDRMASRDPFWEPDVWCDRRNFKSVRPVVTRPRETTLSPSL